MVDQERPKSERVLTKAAFNRMRMAHLFRMLRSFTGDSHPYDDILDNKVVDLDAVRGRKAARETAKELLKRDE